MGWGDLVTAVVGVLVGVGATETVHILRARRENPAIRLAVRQAGEPGAFALTNTGYATAYKVGISAGWATPRGHFRPALHIRDWREVPPGAELHFAVPDSYLHGDGPVMALTWRNGTTPSSPRHLQLWPLR